MLLAILLAICSGGKAVQHCRCDLIEFNTVERDDCPILHQVIFWEWNRQYCRYNARGWVMAESVELVNQHCVSVRGWMVEGTIRRTRTGFDPERENAKLHPHDQRNKMPWEINGHIFNAPMTR